MTPPITALGSRYGIQGALGRSVKRAASGITDPTDISGCLLWYDFSDANSLFTDDGVTNVSSDGDLIYRINDKSGNSNHGKQTTEGYRPVYKTNIQNSKSIARFASDNIDFTSRLTTIRTAYFVFSDADTGNDANRFLLGDTTYSWHRAYTSSDGIRNYFDSTYNYASVYVREGTVHRNGTSVSPVADAPLATIHITAVTTTGNLPANKFQGDRANTHRYWIGDVAEIILYSGAHDDATRQMVENYANSKWSLY